MSEATPTELDPAAVEIGPGSVEVGPTIEEWKHLHCPPEAPVWRLLLAAVMWASTLFLGVQAALTHHFIWMLVAYCGAVMTAFVVLGTVWLLIFQRDYERSRS